MIPYLELHATFCASQLIIRCRSGRGAGREESAHGGCKHRVAPQLPTAELTAEQAAQLQLLRGAELLDTAASRPVSPLTVPLPDVMTSVPESPACGSSTHATNPSASVDSCSAGCGLHSPTGGPMARLRRASSTPALVLRQAATSRDSASSIHRSCSAGAILKAKGLDSPHLAAAAAAAHAGSGDSLAGETGVAAADDNGGHGAGQDASELAQAAGLSARLTVAGLLASADEGLLHGCASPTVSLLSVQLRSAGDSMAMTDSSQGGLARCWRLAGRAVAEIGQAAATAGAIQAPRLCYT